MASLTRWKWVWVNSGSWWWTGRPGVLRFMGLQRVRRDWAELNWTELNWKTNKYNISWAYPLDFKLPSYSGDKAEQHTPGNHFQFIVTSLPKLKKLRANFHWQKPINGGCRKYLFKNASLSLRKRETSKWQKWNEKTIYIRMWDDASVMPLVG